MYKDAKTEPRGTKESQKIAKGKQKAAKGSQTGPEGNPEGNESEPRGAHGSPEDPKLEPKGSQKTTNRDGDKHKLTKCHKNKNYKNEKTTQNDHTQES